MMNRNALLPGLLALAILLHFGCDADSGGIGGSGVTAASEGTVTAYGSIWVNGVRWHIDDADIDVDSDDDGSQADIALGMVVKVYGEVDPETSEGVATQVIQDFALRGPISAIDLPVGGVGTLTVLGQTAVVDGSTLFDPEDPTLTLGSLAVGESVHLSGLVDADSTLHVTYLEGGSQQEVELDGKVSSYDGFEQFQIGGVTVDFDSATTLINLPWGLMNGMKVEVVGGMTGTDAILADTIRFVWPNFQFDLERFDIEGYLTSYSGAAEVNIGAQAVDVSSAQFEGGTLGDLMSGARAEVHGPRVDGTLVAKRVRIFADDDDDDD